VSDERSAIDPIRLERDVQNLVDAGLIERYRTDDGAPGWRHTELAKGMSLDEQLAHMRRWHEQRRAQR
jgi:DNA-binding HxlR family transcriptional regulator